MGKKSFIIKQTVKDVGYNTSRRDILLNFLIGNPKVRTKNAVDCLTETFENFRLKETAIREFVLKACRLTIKRVVFHSASRNDKESGGILTEQDMYFLKNYIC